MRVFMNTWLAPETDPSKPHYPVAKVEVDLSQEAPLVLGALMYAHASASTQRKRLKRESPLENFREINGYTDKCIAYGGWVGAFKKLFKKGHSWVVIDPTTWQPERPQRFYEGIMFGIGQLAVQPEIMETMPGPLQGADLDTMLGCIQYVYSEQVIQGESPG